MATKTSHNKKRLIEALEKHLGVVSSACEEVGLSRRTHYDYYNNDPEYKAAVDDLANVALDFAESQLHKRIKNGDTTGIIFYLKTKGKKRGYVERQEVEHKGEGMKIELDLGDTEVQEDE